MKTIALPFRNSVQCLFALIPLLLVCFWLPTRVHAVSPTPDGAYSGANTAEGGSGALFSLTTGTNNTALGSQALFSLRIGSQNTATGAQALKNNEANSNTADGFQALVRNTAGFDNTATGWRALFANTTGEGNTASGNTALYSNSTGVGNTASGERALFGNTIGSYNTASGAGALQTNTTGVNNTAVGIDALPASSTGELNTALGFDAGSDHMTGDNNIYIGSAGGPGAGAESNTIHIGQQVFEGPIGFDHPAHTATFIAGISGAAVTGTAVVVDGNGQLGVAPSSARFKDEIKRMNNASEAILALRPVTFRYKEGIDPNRTAQFGLVAEEVAQVNPDLIVRDKEGKPYSVRYDQVNAMLLNEFLKEHRKVEQLTKDFESKLAAQQKQIEALTAGLQKVSARLEASKSAQQVVNNNQRLGP